MSQRNEPRTCSNYEDVCVATGYRFASVLVKGTGKTLRFSESAEIHTGKGFRVSVTEDTEQELARAKTDARTNGWYGDSDASQGQAVHQSERVVIEQDFVSP